MFGKVVKREGVSFFILWLFNSLLVKAPLVYLVHDAGSLRHPQPEVGVTLIGAFF